MKNKSVETPFTLWAINFHPPDIQSQINKINSREIGKGVKFNT